MYIVVLVGALAGALGCGGKAEPQTKIDAGSPDAGSPFPSCEMGRPLCGSIQDLICCDEGEQCCPYNFESTMCYPADQPCPAVCGFAPCSGDDRCLQQFLPPPEGLTESCVSTCPAGTTPCGDDFCCGANSRCDTDNECVYIDPPDAGPAPLDGGTEPLDGGAEPPDAGSVLGALGS